MPPPSSGVILWKVIPTFDELFEGLGAALPLPTRVVIASSDALVSYSPLFLVAAVALTLAFRWYRATPRGGRSVDALLLRLPVLGLILRKVAVARFCRTLATLLGSGVPLLAGLEITARTAGNVVIEDARHWSPGPPSSGARRWPRRCGGRGCSRPWSSR